MGGWGGKRVKERKQNTRLKRTVVESKTLLEGSEGCSRLAVMWLGKRFIPVLRVGSRSFAQRSVVGNTDDRGPGESIPRAMLQEEAPVF